VPIIMLSANGHAGDRIKGLEMGADDVVARPFSREELVARVRALLRRRELDRRQMSPPKDRIGMGDIVLDRAAHQVWKDGRPIDMPQREYEMLRVLMENAGQAVSKRELLDQVWGEGWIGYPRTLNVHIYRLRQKLEDDPSAPRYIQTVRSYGLSVCGSTRPASLDATDRPDPLLRGLPLLPAFCRAGRCAAACVNRSGVSGKLVGYMGQ